jgi:hypothetical protein
MNCSMAVVANLPASWAPIESSLTTTSHVLIDVHCFWGAFFELSGFRPCLFGAATLLKGVSLRDSMPTEPSFVVGIAQIQ